MGHIRLGRLAKTQSWQRLVALLDVADVEVSAIARATADGAQERLRALRDDPVLGYTMWLIARLATAARTDAFVEQCQHLGLAVHADDSAIAVVARLNDLVRTEVEQHPQSGPFGEIASLAFRAALLETLGTEQSALFGGSVSTLEQAIRANTTDTAFGNLAQRYFGEVFGRILRFYVDKELPFHIGADSGFADIAASDVFLQDLHTYSRQSARIVDQFASDWLSKHDYLEHGMISREQAQAFVAHAMEKLDAELGLEPVA
jgi:hypothetical protein